MNELQTALLEDPDTLSVHDLNGCLPSYVLADNEALLKGIHGREIVTAFCLQLMKAYPKRGHHHKQHRLHAFCVHASGLDGLGVRTSRQEKTIEGFPVNRPSGLTWYQ